MDMQCTFLSALIYKKPTMRGTAALFTNRKQLKHARGVLFLVCFPLSLFNTLPQVLKVFLQLSHNQRATKSVVVSSLV